jgi:RNA polymerase sigma-70 factor (ECF subfamily)
MQNHRSQPQFSSLPDEELVTLAQAGSNDAFATLIERHHRACEKLACSILRDRQDAEDEVQNACWKAYENIGKFQQDSKFSTWLTRIVVNQCLMRLRQMRRSRLVYLEDTVSEDARPVDLAEPSESPEQALAKTEVAGVLLHEIRRIPPLLRSVFVLRDVQERPMQEVADQLGISVAAAKSRLLRARQELRTRLQRHEGKLGPATLLA